ncbi:hypothetical protein TSOC_012969 [Tetrabaena socialis]|uniref:Uncharacterized protein n=1 Tax=Tetrabaena socialis TaxID=47790 RepID=A0A2J7ZLK9_9CHLO|nr:hypothetical protein TSOC_012969 [Tetrabaena socialis]|eukprot:PNH01155.1 hypothetical protein TSOC_012969 [Tetrabaena socialis]
MQATRGQTSQVKVRQARPSSNPPQRRRRLVTAASGSLREQQAPELLIAPSHRRGEAGLRRTLRRCKPEDAPRPGSS